MEPMTRDVATQFVLQVCDIVLNERLRGIERCSTLNAVGTSGGTVSGDTTAYWLNGLTQAFVTEAMASAVSKVVLGLAGHVDPPDIGSDARAAALDSVGPTEGPAAAPPSHIVGPAPGQEEDNDSVGSETLEPIPIPTATRPTSRRQLINSVARATSAQVFALATTRVAALTCRHGTTADQQEEEATGDPKGGVVAAQQEVAVDKEGEEEASEVEFRSDSFQTSDTDDVSEPLEDGGAQRLETIELATPLPSNEPLLEPHDVVPASPPCIGAKFEVAPVESLADAPDDPKPELGSNPRPDDALRYVVCVELAQSFVQTLLLEFVSSPKTDSVPSGLKLPPVAVQPSEQQETRASGGHRCVRGYCVARGELSHCHSLSLHGMSAAARARTSRSASSSQKTRYRRHHQWLSSDPRSSMRRRPREHSTQLVPSRCQRNSRHPTTQRDTSPTSQKRRQNRRVQRQRQRVPTCRHCRCHCRDL